MSFQDDLIKNYTHLAEEYNRLKKEHEILLEKFYNLRTQNEIYKHMVDTPK